MERLLVALQIPQAQLQDIFAMGSQQDRPQDVYSDLISSADMDAMRKVLITQRDGLQHLTDILMYVLVTTDESLLMTTTITSKRGIPYLMLQNINDMLGISSAIILFPFPNPHRKDSRDIEIMKQRLKSTAPVPQAR